MEIAEAVKGFKRFPVANKGESKEWPKTFKCRFIEPGLVHYDDMGTVLVQRPALNKMAQSFVGKPVIDEIHKDAKPENFKDIADGVVIRVWTDPTDGWDWCEFLVWDEATMKHCKSREYSVSCAYTPTEVNEKGGTHNNLAYDGEFLNGVYTHLAIVRDPRYEQAKIVVNSKGGTMFNLFRKKTQEETVELDGATEIEIDGERVPLSKMVDAHNALNAQKNAIKDDAVLVVNGKEVSIKELKDAYVANKKAKNEKEHDHDKEENCGKGCPAYSSKNSEGEKGEKAGDQDKAVKKEKEEGKKEDKENAKDEDEKDDKKAENSTKEKGAHLQEFAETMEMRNTDPLAPRINTMSERLAAGHLRYGGVKKKEDA